MEKRFSVMATNSTFLHDLTIVPGRCSSVKQFFYRTVHSKGWSDRIPPFGGGQDGEYPDLFEN
jgi:hypothetical protein